uniref:Uncharacterized protein n=1 Tax=Picea glauca TaxID=3330 RepID=A0A101M0S9_PICGL|nr:hypothetical protein ABT39_MTgene4163 [Picea glauca]
MPDLKLYQKAPPFPHLGGPCYDLCHVQGFICYSLFAPATFHPCTPGKSLTGHWSLYVPLRLS